MVENGVVAGNPTSEEVVEHCCERGKTGLYCENDCKFFDGDFHCKHPDAIKEHRAQFTLDDPLAEELPDCDHMCC